MSILLSTTSLVSIELIIWAICIGVSLGFIYNFISRAIAGPFVRALLNKDCIGAEKGITLSALGFNRVFLKLLLRDGSALRNTVSVVGDKLPTAQNGKRAVIDYQNARFYIAEAKKEKASATFGEKEKWYLLIVFIVLAVACAYGMTQIMPLLTDALFK